MPGVKGKAPKAKGVKGRSGRKSAYRELLDAKYLVDLVMKKVSRGELRSAITDEKLQLNMIERMVMAAHMGKERSAIAIFNKLFPDHIKLEDDQNVEHYFILN
jgi:hypothetical protein